jgi:hypothetical protein
LRPSDDDLSRVQGKKAVWCAMANLGQASFGVTTPTQFYDLVVRPQYRLFKRSYPYAASPSAQQSRHAILSIICTYHMYDWFHGGDKFSRTHFDRHHRGQTAVRDMFEIARKVANGSKHFESRIASRVDASFSPAFSPAFAQEAYPALLIGKDDGTELHVRDLLASLIGFWESQRAAGKL